MWLIFLYFLLQFHFGKGRHVIVECPACHTRYRTDSSALIDENTLFECSQEQCQYVFPYTLPVLRSGDSDASPSAASPATSSPKLPDPPPKKLPITPPPARSASKDAPPEPALSGEQEDFPPLETESETESEEQFSAGPVFNKELDEPEPFSHVETPFFADEEEVKEERITLDRPTPKQEVNEISSLRPIFALLGFILLGYAALATYCLWNIPDTEEALSRLPLLGSLFTDERFSARHISLVDLKAGFWTTKENHRVFAISGKAVNNAFLPALSIQIEGGVYDAQGKLVGQRVIFCGTETSVTTLESLTIREIGILQNLVPPKQFNVPAGQSINFLIVFTSPPSRVLEFSTRVIAAQFGSP